MPLPNECTNLLQEAGDLLQLDSILIAQSLCVLLDLAAVFRAQAIRLEAGLERIEVLAER